MSMYKPKLLCNIERRDRYYFDLIQTVNNRLVKAELPVPRHRAPVRLIRGTEPLHSG
jgi:hypothetical protein